MGRTVVRGNRDAAEVSGAGHGQGKRRRRETHLEVAEMASEGAFEVLLLPWGAEDQLTKARDVCWQERREVHGGHADVLRRDGPHIRREDEIREATALGPGEDLRDRRGTRGGALGERILLHREGGKEEGGRPRAPGGPARARFEVSLRRPCEGALCGEPARLGGAESSRTGWRGRIEKRW